VQIVNHSMPEDSGQHSYLYFQLMPTNIECIIVLW